MSAASGISLPPGGVLVGLGADLIEVERVRGVLERQGPRFLDRVFTEEERTYCSGMAHPHKHYAARFAAKEAVSKCFTTGIGAELGWRSVSVYHGVRNEPLIRLDEKGAALLAQVGATHVMITLSHTETHAMAVAALVRALARLRMDDPAERPPSPSRLSKTPSWVSLGFVIGALFVWALPREPKTAVSPSADPVPTVRLDRPKATDIEAVFAEWGHFAVWDHDLTEVALWDVDRKSYTIFYEILRSGDACYFRSIPQLTRPVLTHGVPRGAPLQFTETEEMRREWLSRDVSVTPVAEGK